VPSRKTTQAAAEAASVEEARAAVEAPSGPATRGTAGPGGTDPLIGDLRRAGLLPLLVLHFVSQEPSYGNQLMDRIVALTAGALAVNPNTMYPLLRSLEAEGHVAGEWEHPERRSRRFYRITDSGRAELERLGGELRPRLDRIAASIDAILDWWVFAEGTVFEARDYLERFLDEGAAVAAAGFGEPKAPLVADFSLASVAEVLAWIGARVELVDVPPPPEVPAWVQTVLDQHGGGFCDVAEASRPLVLQAAYYLGASFVTSYPVLHWEIGREDRPEVRQPVVTGFASGEDMPVLGVAENALLAGDPGAAVRQWRHAVAFP
jgi:PadR family transcriptional regulator, regulatory protein PadR